MAETLKHFNGSLVLSGSRLAQKDLSLLYAYGQQAYDLLNSLGGSHMFHPAPEVLAGYMFHQHAVLLTDEKEQIIHGVVKAAPWLVLDPSLGKGDIASLSPFQALQLDAAKVVGLEIGSLVIAEGQQNKRKGRRLVEEMCESISTSYPHIPRIAVVTNDNGPSLHVFRNIGWQEIDAQDAWDIMGVDVLDGWEPASSIFLDRSSI